MSAHIEPLKLIQNSRSVRRFASFWEDRNRVFAGDNSRDHKEDHHQYAGTIPATEQAAYRNFADKAVNYQLEGVGWLR